VSIFLLEFVWFDRNFLLSSPGRLTQKKQMNLRSSCPSRSKSPSVLSMPLPSVSPRHSDWFSPSIPCSPCHCSLVETKTNPQPLFNPVFMHVVISCQIGGRDALSISVFNFVAIIAWCRYRRWSNTIRLGCKELHT